MSERLKHPNRPPHVRERDTEDKFGRVPSSYIYRRHHHHRQRQQLQQQDTIDTFNVVSLTIASITDGRTKEPMLLLLSSMHTVVEYEYSTGRPVHGSSRSSSVGTKGKNEPWDRRRVEP